MTWLGSPPMYRDGFCTPGRIDSILASRTPWVIGPHHRAHPAVNAARLAASRARRVSRHTRARPVRGATEGLGRPRARPCQGTGRECQVGQARRHPGPALRTRGAGDGRAGLDEGDRAARAAPQREQRGPAGGADGVLGLDQRRHHGQADGELRGVVGHEARGQATKRGVDVGRAVGQWRDGVGGADARATCPRRSGRRRAAARPRTGGGPWRAERMASRERPQAITATQPRSWSGPAAASGASARRSPPPASSARAKASTTTRARPVRAGAGARAPVRAAARRGLVRCVGPSVQPYSSQRIRR